MSVKSKAPKDWDALWDAASRYRQSIVAPVDEMGCERLYADKSTPEDRRFQILVGLMLSAQTKDPVTAAASENLMRHFKPLTVHAIVRSNPTEIDGLINKVGFHQRKADFIHRTAHMIVDNHNGVVPAPLEDLLKFPGVGPKMAHLFTQCADGVTVGIGVDTHVHRIARRWKWTSAKASTPEHTRMELEAWLPREHWRPINKLMVGLGQSVCKPIGPLCGDCQLNSLCPTGRAAVRSGTAKRAGVKKEAHGGVKMEAEEEDVGGETDADEGEGALVKTESGIFGLEGGRAGAGVAGGPKKRARRVASTVLSKKAPATLAAAAAAVGGELMKEEAEDEGVDGVGGAGVAGGGVGDMEDMFRLPTNSDAV